MQNNKHLWLGVLGATLLIPNAALANISGKVFRDFNANGTFDTSVNFNEVGFAGTTVKAFDATGTQVATTTSGADGAYTLTGLTSGATYRLEFSWAESWLQSGVAGGTSVQFVQDGVSGINFAVQDPTDYSQPNPQIATSQFLVGIPTAAEVSGKPAVLEFAYLSGASGRDFAVTTTAGASMVDETTDIAVSAAPGSAGTGNAASPVTAGHSKIINATLDKIGPVFGLAYHRPSNVLFAASFMKRFAGFPGGPSDAKLGSIYKIDRNTSPNTVSTFFTANAGADSHDYLSSDMGAPTGDTAAGASASKVGWGDIDLSGDGAILYAVNLYDRSIYAIPVTTSGTAGSPEVISFPSSVTSGLCSNNDWRPGGVKAYRGDVYVTVSCTAETSQAVADLHHYVYKFPQVGTHTFTQVVDMPNYQREEDWAFGWRPWTANTAILDGTTGNTGDQNRYRYSQPWLTDIEFDDVGRMYLGVRNRSGNMRAAFNSDDQSAFEYGDTVVATANGDGTYTVLESSNSGQTPPYELIDDHTMTTGEHPENDMGSLAILPGSGELLTPATVGNMIEGIRTYNIDVTGTAARSVLPVRYYGVNQMSASLALGNPFGKMGGLGDIELLSQAAPIEIGNRIWLDTNSNGIQDAGENGIPGVSVELRSGASVIATATTAADGAYYFSSATGTDTASIKYGLTQLQPNTAYTVKFPTSVEVSGTTYNLTTANAGSNRLIDSNAAATGDVVVNASDIPTSGANNHSFDVGYSSAPPPTGCTTITNAASITQSGVSDPVAGNNSASASIQANCTTPKTDLKLVKTASKTTVRKGETLTYTLVLENESDVDATGVVVNDKLPTAMTYVSHAPATASYDSATGDWTVGTLAARQKITLTIDVTVK